MKMKLIYVIQKLFGLILKNPIIPVGKVSGFSLVKSQKAIFQQGKHTNVVYPCTIFDVILGDYSYIAKNSNITNTTIGKFCSIGPNFCCGMGIHPIEGLSTTPMFYSTARQNGITLATKNKISESERVTIGHDVFIGVNVTILDGVCVGDGSIIGAGAVVTKDIPPYAIAVGVPAKVVKYRFEKEQIDKLLKIKWWNFDDEKLKEVERYFFDIDLFIEKSSTNIEN